MPMSNPGITKLSELDVDGDKVWGAHNITNLGAAASDVNAIKRHAFYNTCALAGYRRWVALMPAPEFQMTPILPVCWLAIP